MKPTFNAVVVTEKDAQGEPKKFYTDCGAGWVQKDFQGINVKLIPNVAASKFQLFINKDAMPEGVTEADFIGYGERLDVYTVTNGEGDNKDFWNRVGSAFFHKRGYSVVIAEGLAVVGECVLRAPKPKAEQ